MPSPSGDHATSLRARSKAVPGDDFSFQGRPKALGDRVVVARSGAPNRLGDPEPAAQATELPGEILRTPVVMEHKAVQAASGACRCLKGGTDKAGVTCPRLRSHLL